MPHGTVSSVSAANRTGSDTRHPLEAVSDRSAAEGAYARLKSRGLTEGTIVADKSPKKSTPKTAASKSLKEKRAEKKDKAASKSKD